jgi:hypothetical protein
MLWSQLNRGILSTRELLIVEPVNELVLGGNIYFEIDPVRHHVHNSNVECQNDGANETYFFSKMNPFVFRSWQFHQYCGSPSVQTP